MINKITDSRSDSRENCVYKKFSFSYGKLKISRERIIKETFSKRHISKYQIATIVSTILLIYYLRETILDIIMNLIKHIIVLTGI